MQIDTTKYRLDRDAGSTDYSDLITSGAVRSGDPYWDESTPDLLILPFTPEPTAAEQWAIIRRLFTIDAAEEDLYKQSETAQTNNTSWRTNTSPQITTQAQAIENAPATLTNTQRDQYIHQLGQGVRLLNTQLSTVTNQMNQVIDMLQTQLERG